jgi:hypothetical protein
MFLAPSDVEEESHSSDTMVRISHSLQTGSEGVNTEGTVCRYVHGCIEENNLSSCEGDYCSYS